MQVPEEVVRDFRNHLYFCFKYLGLGEPTAMQYEIARNLQEGDTDMIVCAGRGMGKSTILSCFASWEWLTDPNLTIIVLSATHLKAIDFISQTRKILSLVPYMKYMVPGENSKDSAIGFNVDCRTKVTQDLSCTARGISGQITGLHADRIYLDDIEISGKNETPVSKESLLKKLTELESMRNRGSRVIFLGTPHSIESIYITLKESYPIVLYPAEYPDLDSPTREYISPYILNMELSPGDATDPVRFPKDELMARKAKMGDPKAYALQYKLDWSLSDLDKYPLKLSDLIIIDVDPEKGPDKVIWQGRESDKTMYSIGLSGDLFMEPMHISPTFSKFKQTVMTIDPSGRGADETGICIASTLNGYVYIHELLGIQGGYKDEILNKIAKMCIEYNVNVVKYESNFGDGLFGKVLQPVLMQSGVKAAIEEVRAKGQKEARIINILKPVMDQHKLVINRKAAKDETNQYQITRLTRNRGCLKHDDRVDALAYAVDHFKESIVLNADEVIERNKKEEHLRTIKNWENNFRAGDYVYNSGALKPLVEQPIKLRKNKQWGW